MMVVIVWQTMKRIKCDILSIFSVVHMIDKILL